MTNIPNIVMDELSKHSELVPIDNGYSWQRGGGHTSIWFTPVNRNNERDPVSIAYVETLFDPRYEINDSFSLAHLNSRACFGSYFAKSKRLGLRLSYSLFSEEPTVRWVAIALLRAMGEQLALGQGIAESDLYPDTLSANRANLEYPRKWDSLPSQNHFMATVAAFREAGFTANCDHKGMVLEVPLSGHSPSRMIDNNAETALLHLWSSVTHPIAGVGYAGSIALPIDPSPANIPGWAEYLNEAEHSLHEFVPRLGAWGARSCGNELVYSLFWPADTPDDGLVETIMNWLVHRTHWIKSNYWEHKKGLRIPGGNYE